MLVIVGGLSTGSMGMLHYKKCKTFPGADPGIWEGGSEHKGGSLKQGVWRRSPPEVIGCFLFIALKSCQNARFKAYSYLFKEIQGT